MNLSIPFLFLLVGFLPWLVFGYVRLPKNGNMKIRKQIRNVREADYLSFAGINDHNNEDEEVVDLTELIKPLHYVLEFDIFVEEEKFGGSVEIDINCKRNTDVIGVNVKNINIKEDNLMISLKDSSTTIHIIDFHLDKENYFFIMNLEHELKEGQNYTLKMDFKKESKFAKQFFNTYKDEKGQRKKFAVLPSNDVPAKEMFPCLDGFGLEATFDITVIRPNNLQSTANMEIKKQEVKNSKRIADIYYTSPLMNPNSINIIVSDYAYTEQLTQSGVKIRVWAPKYQINFTKIAANISSHSLDGLEKYFDSQLPIKKIDFISIPELSAAGIASLGIIMCNSGVLILDDEATLDDKKYTADILAHENSHQWFGVMIHPIDYENQWFNEAFANFISNEITEKLLPDWKMDESFVLNQMHVGMKEDSTFLSHPLTVPSGIHQEGDDFTDLNIAYYKGSCIFRTLRAGMGERSFIKGIQIFVKKFLHNTASADDLWDALSQAASEDKDSDDEDFKAVAHSWTLQMGYPVIKIERNYYNGRTTVTQQHFIDRSSTFGKNNRFPDQGYQWIVPVTYITSTNKNWNSPQRFWLHDSSHVHDRMSPERNEWILGNVNIGGFYRVNYDSRNWQMLADQMELDYTEITPINRAALFDDAFNLANFGFNNITTALDFTTYIAMENDFLPFETMIDHLQIFHDRYADDQMRKNMQIYLNPKLKSKYESFDWETLPIDALNRTTREKLFRFMCHLKLEDCVKTTTEKFSWYISNIAKNRLNRLESLILCFGIKHGSTNLFDRVFKLAEDSKKGNLIAALTCTTDSKKIKQLIEMTFMGMLVPEHDQADMISYLSANPSASKLVFTYLIDNWGELMKSKSGDNFMNKLPDYVENINSASDLEKLKRLGSKYKTHKKWNIKIFNKSLDLLRTNVQWMKFNKAAARQWLNYAADI